MLNELHEIAVSLETSSAGGRRLHSCLREAASTNVAKVSVSGDGKVAGVRIAVVGEPEHGILLKYVPDKQKSWPVVNMPVFRLTDGEILKALAKNPKAFAAAYATMKEVADFARPWRMMLEAANEIAGIAGPAPSYASAFTAVIEALNSVDRETLVRQVEQKLLALVQAGDVNAIAMLAHDKPANSKAQWCFELDHWKKFPLNSAEVYDWMNGRLLSAVNTGAACTAVDAYGNDCSPDEFTVPFPEFQFRGAQPRSMWTANPANPSKARYVRGYGAFPVSANTRQSLSNAGRWMLSPDKEGSLWRSVPGCEKPTLMIGIAFSEGNRIRLHDKAGVVNCVLTVKEVAKPKGDDDALVSDDEAVAVPTNLPFINGEELYAGVSQTLALLDGTSPAESVREVKLLVLESYSQAQTTVVLDRRLTRESLLDAAARWDEGCNGIPPVSLNLPMKERRKGGGPSLMRPKRPRPSDVMAVLNRARVRFGEEKNDLRRINFEDTMRLFLDPDELVRPLATACLRGCLSSYGTTWATMAGHANRWSQYPHPAFEMLHVPCVVGLLLHKLGWKGNYMQDAAYNLGLILKHSDRLHVAYCDQVRKGDVPGVLLGSGFVQLILGNPTFGWKALNLRQKPYFDWAKKFTNDASTKGTDTARNVRGMLIRIEKSVERLTAAGMPGRLNDEQAARLFLGYGASLKADGREEQEVVPQ